MYCRTTDLGRHHYYSSTLPSRVIKHGVMYVHQSGYLFLPICFLFYFSSDGRGSVQEHPIPRGIPDNICYVKMRLMAALDRAEYRVISAMYVKRRDTRFARIVPYGRAWDLVRISAQEPGSDSKPARLSHMQVLPSRRPRRSRERSIFLYEQTGIKWHAPLRGLRFE